MTRQANVLLLAVLTSCVAWTTVDKAIADPSSIMYMTFAGYEEAMFHEDYVAKHGGSPNTTFYSDEHEAIAKVSAGFRADVAHVCTDNLPYWRGHDLLRPLDTSRLAHWDDVFPALRNIETIEDEQGLWMIPWDWGFTSIIYRTDIVSFDEPSFNVLMDPAYAGRVSIQDSLVDVGPTVALISGAQDPFDLSPSEISKWRDTLAGLTTQSRFLWSDPANLQQALASGEVVAAMGWPDTVANLKAEGHPVELMTNPKEGMLTWVCGLALLKDGTGPVDQAYDLINAMTATSAGQALVEEYYLATSLKSVYPNVDTAHLDSLELDDVETKLDEARFYEPVPEDQRQALLTIFGEIKAGM